MATPMHDSISIRINGRSIKVPPGTIVAAAVTLAGVACFHRSVLDQPRGPLCGMGICMECRVTINEQLHCRSCQRLCEQGMVAQTDHSDPRYLSSQSEPVLNRGTLEFEIVVVGGGPAGVAAACAAAESGRRVAVVDDTPWL